MSHALTAVYEHGVFRPDQPVSLAEGTKVDLQVMPHTLPDMTPEEALAGLQKLGDSIRLPDDYRFDRESLYDRG